MNGKHGLTKQQRTRTDDSSQSPSVIGRKTLLELLEQQNYRCALSGEELTPETASLDHKTPITRGGSNHISNIQIVTQHVNAAKGTMTVEEFVAVCRKVAEYSAM
jgi:5-methylcytosine-specific restriction endonuclease McrA